MVSPAPARLATEADLMALPDDGYRYEIVRGWLVCMEASSPESSELGAEVGAEIRNFVRANKLGRICMADCGFRISDNPLTVRVPDFAFIRAERIPPEGMPRAVFPGAPDLAVEAVSPSDRYTDLAEKVKEWLAAGCRAVWVVDPRRRLTEVHQSGQPTLHISFDQPLDGGTVLPGFSLVIASLGF